MSSHNSNDSETSSAAEQPSPAAFDLETLSPRQMRVVLVCDVVESVRWMEHDEDNAITRWSQFAAAVRSRIAPAHAGSVVKSTGDGLMLEFESAPQAVAAANAMQKLASEGNVGYESKRQMHLRVGIHQAQVRRDAHDLYGHGVNLAARISTLAGPGEIIVTPEVRDHLTDSLDGDIEDMGECYLKHLSEPQRVYRVGVASTMPVLTPENEYKYSLKPTLAVIPFRAHTTAIDTAVIGDLIADGIIAVLVRSNTINVLSRFSTTALREHSQFGHELHNLLGADYVLRGDFHVFSDQIISSFELSSTHKGVVVAAGRNKSSIADLFQTECELCGAIAHASLNSIIDEEVKSALSQPLPTLASYSLFLAGVTGIHRSLPSQHRMGELALQKLIDRHTRAADPKVWLAQWLAIRASRDSIVDGKQALSTSKKLVNEALQVEPNNSFALSVLGLTQAYFERRFHAAEVSYTESLSLNPSNYLAWLYKATLMAWLDRPIEGMNAAHTALQLTPLHPLRYYIESLAAMPFLVAGEYSAAIALFKSSIKANRAHSASHRGLIAGLALAGLESEARSVANDLMVVDPTFRVSKFIARYPGNEGDFSTKFSSALLASGIPN